MADMVLSPLVGMVIEMLMSEIIKNVRMAWQVEDDLNTLSDTLKSIQDVLADAEEVDITKKTVKAWVSKLKDIAYDADDVLDELQYEAFRQLAEGDQTDEGKGKQVRNFFLSCFCFRPNPILSRLGVAERIKIINERVATASRDKEEFNLREDDGIRSAIRHDTERLPTSSVPMENEFEFLGGDKDREEIIKWLLSNDAEICRGRQAYSVISIVGMGGLGKTTLLQYVYNDGRVVKHFEVRAWACVSEKFDVAKITKDIIESAGEKCNSSTIDPLQCQLLKILETKTFLIVLDDVWNEECSRWDSLRRPFNAGAKGSKIVVTTRNEAVSRAMHTAPPYPMKPLANDDCILLLLQHAFAGERYDAHPKLMKIAKELVDRHCQGLPLAARLLGSLLYGREDSSLWESILNSQIWISGDNKSDVMKVLRVSYYHLPSHVKQCFAFCSVFRKDYLFTKDKLVRLWMAQGFIEPTKSMLSEERGSKYFDYLLQRSFFQRNDEDTFSVTYKMHDCIHDLAESVSSEEYLRVEHDTTTLTPNDRLRHISLLKLQTDSRVENLRAFNQCKRLRTIIIKGHFRQKMPQQAIKNLIVNFKCLRVMIMAVLTIEELPDSISDLKHLRYLDLTDVDKITKLPESMSSLYSLQTLLLCYCQNLCSWPREIRKLINLRHLDVKGCGKLTTMPLELGKLSSLQTLSTIIVGRESGNNIGELKGLTQLRGRISIKKLQNVSNAEEAKEACLKDKEHIKELALQWDEREEAPLQEELGEILEALQPHQNLEFLEIVGYEGNIYPTWLNQKKLPNLKRFTFGKCKNCTSLPPLGQFCKLESLTIGYIEGLKRIGRELFGDREIKASFPMLKILEIKCMPSLEEWCQFNEEGSGFSHLQKLVIDDCPKLTKMSIYFSVVKDIELNYCHQLTCLPTWPSLDKLLFQDCNEILLRNWVPRLTSLSHLTILNFPNLTSLPKGMLHSLFNLKHLRIALCEKLESFVDDEDEGLPSTLVSLVITECYNLKSLGEKYLATALQSLMIRSCPQLKIEDWAKISHIPYKDIDDKIISQAQQNI